MILRHPAATRTYPLLPCTTLFRSRGLEAVVQRAVAVGRREAGRLARRAVAGGRGHARGRDADVAVDRMDALLQHARLSRLPAEAAERQRLAPVVPHPVRTPGNAVAVEIGRAHV